MVFSKILVSYDGSKQAKKALDKAIELAALNTSMKLEVLQVYDYMHLYVADALIQGTSQMDIEALKYAEKSVEEAKERLQGIPNSSNVELRQGPAARTILEYAKEAGCDLIVIGSRGLGAIGEIVLGSVSHNVVQHAKIPVLVIK